MQYTPEKLQALRCYAVYFWGHEDDHIFINTKQAAGIKYAIKNGLNYFEIGKNMYMVKDIKRIEFNKDFESLEWDKIEQEKRGSYHPHEFVEGATFEMLDTNYYLKNPKLLELPYELSK